MTSATLLGPDGQPIRKTDLRREVATPTIGGVRPLYDDYPSQGLTPGRLGLILRDAVESDARPYLRLAEEMLEKDPHLLAIVNTRRLQVAQLEVSVEPAGEDQAALDQAAFVEQWLARDELTDELVDLLDAIVKGYSVCEIVWDTSGGQWWPAHLLWRDPAWFVFDREDGRTLNLRTEADSYRGEPLPPFKFIDHRHKAKAGLAIRGGLGRCLAWVWLFKNFDVKSWVAFSEAYGQPLRIGKYGASATDEERATLLRAVRGLGRDMAAIIPDSMLVDLVEAKTGGQVDLFQRLADFMDRQASKAVLGQTTTTDAISGGHAVSREHNEVREDIERADARILAQTLNRQLIQPLVALNFGPQTTYPRLRIGRPEALGVPELVDALAKLVPHGLRVSQEAVRRRLCLPPPDEGEDVLGSPAAPPPQQAKAAIPATTVTARPDDDLTPLINRLGALAELEMQALVARVRQVIDEAGSLEEASAQLLALYPRLDLGDLARLYGDAMTIADAAGMGDRGA